MMGFSCAVSFRFGLLLRHYHFTDHHTSAARKRIPCMRYVHRLPMPALPIECLFPCISYIQAPACDLCRALIISRYLKQSFLILLFFYLDPFYVTKEKSPGLRLQPSLYQMTQSYLQPASHHFCKQRKIEKQRKTVSISRPSSSSHQRASTA